VCRTRKKKKEKKNWGYGDGGIIGCDVIEWSECGWIEEGLVKGTLAKQPSGFDRVFSPHQWPTHL